MGGASDTLRFASQYATAVTPGESSTWVSFAHRCDTVVPTANCARLRPVRVSVLVEIELILHIC